MVTTLPGHEVTVRIGTSTLQTLDGGDAMDPRSDSTPAPSSDPAAGTVTQPVVNNGPGVTKAPAISSSSSVIQAPFSPGVLSGRAPAINGSNVAASAPLIPAAIKTESPQTVIQTATHTGSPQVSPGAAKNAGLLVRGGAPLTGGGAPVAAHTVTAGVRTIAPQQVLAPRLPHSNPGQTSIQLPPGMVLVRSETGQLLMIPQQILAQMQAQLQATRANTPTSTAPGQIPPTQSPAASILTRPVAPSIIKQGSPTTTPTATPPLQRPPVQPPAVGSVLAVQPGGAQRMVTPATGTNVTLGTETMENVKKCRNFLSTLIKLATSAKQSTQTAANVKELVKNLLEATIEAEDFTSRLYKELNSSPQPYLVPFLKRSLPALRQLTPDSMAFIQQSQGLQQVKPAASVVLTSPPAANSVTTPTAQSVAPAVSATSASVTAVTRTHPQPSLATTSQPSVVLSTQQPGTIVKSPQVNLATPMVTLRGQPSSRIVVSQSQIQLNTVAMKPGMTSGAKITPGALALAAAQKSKLKDATGGTFKDDDDINDVASMAGVNLSEESARILATNSELVGSVTRSCKDEAFLFSASLQHRMQEIGKRFGVTDLGPDVVNLVSHATQQRLQNLLEKVTVIAQQKNMNYKEDGRFEQMTDVRAQLKFFEQLDQLEKQKKEEQEREILMKAAKSRSRQEDPEQLRLKQKAKEMQQQELAQIRQRDANLTALAAIGPRKKRKLDSPARSADTEGSGSSTGTSVGLGGGSSRQFTRQRITRVNLRDLLFCLENEKASSHSQLLYRALLK